MWWVAEDGRAYPGFDPGGPVVLARGLGGHVVAVIPHLDLVIVHRVNSSMPNPANYVGARDLGTLLQMIVDASPATAETTASR
jgi:CubicO group peptidase (beta-lactamase class C family)